MPVASSRRGLAALLLVGALSACAAEDGAGTPTAPATPTPTTTTAPTAAAAPADEVDLFEFQIAGGRASPPLERATVEQGATVRIVVTSDQPDEVHLHGYDRSADVGPGQPGVIEFVADQTGLFELETHETRLVLLQLQVR